MCIRDSLQVLRPRLSGDVSYVDTESVHLVNCREGLELLRGNVDLSSIEDELAEAHVQRFANRAHFQKTYVALGDLFRRLASERNFDHVLIDVGPSSGALTRACFLSCDGFFIPTAPDRFNVQAIGTLASILDRWLTEHAQVVGTYRQLGLPVAPGRPVFLGAIIQFFKTHKGKPKPGYQLWNARLPTQLLSRLKPVLDQKGEGERGMFFPTDNDGLIAAEIPDFQSLAPLMQEVGKAVFDISQSDTALIRDSGIAWSGQTWTDAEERMKGYRRCFEALARRILEASL